MREKGTKTTKSFIISLSVTDCIFCWNLIVKFENDVCKIEDNFISIIIFLFSHSFMTCPVQLNNIRRTTFVLRPLKICVCVLLIKGKIVSEGKECVKEIDIYVRICIYLCIDIYHVQNSLLDMLKNRKGLVSIG